MKWRVTLGLTLSVLLLSGCGQTGASPGASMIAAPPASPAVASPSPVASIEPSAFVQPSATAADEPSPAEPPAASIAVDGGDPVVGQLGSYTWRGAGSDAPWLDGNPIQIGAEERLTVTLADPIGVANWTAARVTPGQRDGSTAIGMGDGAGEPVALDGPPRGSWSVNVTVWFSDGRGSAAYYWLVDVE